MDKVWFKLRQTDYPPPPEETILAGDGDDSAAPICLGHIIPDLKHIDYPINHGAIHPFPLSMRVFHTQTLEFKWDETNTEHAGCNVGAGAPILAAAGITVKASLQLTFAHSVDNHEAYDRLESYIVQPNKRYVNKCLKRGELKGYIGKKSSWSVFIITGIKVARGGTRATRETAGVHVEAGPVVDIPGLVTAEVTTNAVREQTREMYGVHPSDFIWAVRLAKIHKGLLSSDWSIDPYTKRATFGTGDEDVVDVEGVLKKEGLDKFATFYDGKLGEAFVL